MKRPARFRFRAPSRTRPALLPRPWPWWLVLSLACLAVASEPARAAESPPGPESINTPATNPPAAADADLQLRAYLKLQEQLHATLLAIEQGRLESTQSSQEARTNAESLATRLEALEKSLARQREQQWQTLQDSHRTMLLFTATAIGLGLVALAFTALFQSRGMNRLADIATNMSQDRPFPATAMHALGEGDHLLLANGVAAASSRNLLATVERLQQRIQDLERTAHPELPFAELPAASRPAPPAPPADQLAALTGKAQVLLSLGQMEEALACYDQALQHDATHAETHLKRGQILEKLRRFDEAISAYDRAIQLNRRLTQAYLSKGSVYNQQERYSEALASYEEALRAESKP